MVPRSQSTSSLSRASEVHHLGVEVLFERAVGVVDVRATPPDMPAAKVASGLPEDDDLATGHVFTTVVADALDDRVRAGVADREPLTHDTTQEQPGRWWRRTGSRFPR